MKNGINEIIDLVFGKTCDELVIGSWIVESGSSCERIKKSNRHCHVRWFMAEWLQALCGR